MSVALKGIKVLDLSRVLAGPWASMTLGDLGAEIWKIEQPEVGDDSRAWIPPSIEGISTYFLAANRNKKSIAIDIGISQGREVIVELAKRADILIENFRPASLRKFRLTYDELKEINPRLIVCSISGYGRGHHLEERPGYDFIIQAESGFMSITGEKAGEPMRLGVAFVDLITGMNAVQAILAALYMRERTGEGQWLDISLTDGALFMLANIASGYLNTGREPTRFGNAHPSIVPYQLFTCADGKIAVAVGNDEQFRRFCRVVGRADLGSDPRFANNRSRVEHRETLLAMLDQRIAELTSADLIRDLLEAMVPAGEVRTVKEAFASDVAELRRVVVEVPHPIIGTFRTVRSPLRMSASEQAPPTPPPEIGSDTDSVLSEVIGYSTADLERLRKSGAIA